MKLEHKITDVRRYNSYPQDVKEFYDGCARAFIATIPEINSDDFKNNDFEVLKTQINQTVESFSFEMSDAFQKAVEIRVETILKENNIYQYGDVLDQIRAKLENLEQQISPTNPNTQNI